MPDPAAPCLFCRGWRWAAIDIGSKRQQMSGASIGWGLQLRRLQAPTATALLRLIVFSASKNGTILA
jgi:hypothetical protein